MSGPVQGTDREGPLRYVPKRTRVQEGQEGADTSDGNVRVGKVTSPPEPPWKRKSQRGVFAGDVAIAELRHQLLHGDPIPEPVLQPRGITLRTWMDRTIRVGLIASAGVIAYLWQSASSEGPFVLASSETKLSPTMAAASLKTSGANTASPSLPEAANSVAPSATTVAVSAPGEFDEGPAVSTSTVPGVTKPPAEELRPAWLPSPQPSPAVRAQPPSAVTAPMQKSPFTRPTDNVSGRLNSHLRPLNTTDIAVIMKTASEFMANRNIGAARMMFQAAAAAGDPVAAFALAETYDPLVLRTLHTKGGIAPDAGFAQTWYQKAKDLGSDVAAERLERLVRIGALGGADFNSTETAPP